MSVILPLHRAARLALALLLLAGQPTLAGDCGSPATAEVSATTVLGLAGMGFTVEQVAVMHQQSSTGGTDGTWIISEWSHLTTLPMADPLFAERGNVIAVPDWDANCTGKATSPTTVLGTCTGAIAVTVKNGVISWAGGGPTMGRITGGTGGAPAGISLNILPDVDGMDWTMHGTVTPGTAGPKIAATVTGMRNQASPEDPVIGVEITLRLDVTPAETRFVNALELLETHTGTQFITITRSPPMFWARSSGCASRGRRARSAGRRSAPPPCTAS